jgi:hypothetical protein
MRVDWQREIIGQLEFYWDSHLWPRLSGLTDDEYLWEPVGGCWSVRPDADGRWQADLAWPEPDPPPVTTIAWRLLHIGLGCLAMRTQAFFADDDRDMFTVGRELFAGDLPSTAAAGLALLERSYRDWHEAIAGLDAAGFEAPLGPKGGPYAESSMGSLVIHNNREIMHHGGEIGVLRDLYRAGYRCA